MSPQDESHDQPTLDFILQANANYLQKRTERQIVIMLLKGFKTDVFDSKLHWIGNDRVLDLQAIFNKLEPEAQENFKAATVRALVEWRLKSHGTHVLTELATLAVYIGASEIFGQTRIILKDPDWLNSVDWKTYSRTVSILIASLSGFKVLDEVKDLFEDLYSDPKFEPFVAQLFMAFCRRQPRIYTHYLPRFLQIAGRYEHLRIDLIIRDFEREVKLPTIVHHLTELPDDSLLDLISLLCFRSWSPAKLQMREVSTSSDWLNNSSQELCLEYKEVNETNAHITFALYRYLEARQLELIQRLYIDQAQKILKEQGGAVNSVIATLEGFIPPPVYTFG